MRTVLLSLLCAVAPVLQGLSYRVTAPAGGPADLKVTLSAQRVDATADVIRHEIAVPSAGSIAVTEGSWELRVDSEQVPVALLEGAAVIGTVERLDRTRLPADIPVCLVPSSAAPQDARRLGRQTKPNAKGFFEIVSIPPGEYFITASSKTLTSDSRQVAVIANRTAELRAPLVVDTPKRVRATISPALDPDDQPWNVTLLVKRRGMQHYDSAASSKASVDGVWEQKGLRGGEYLLTVGRTGGSEWESMPLVVGASDVEIRVDVPAVAVKGSVTYGDQPIAARLTFGGENGPRRQTIATDQDGKFSGIVPANEKNAWDIFVESDSPPMRRTLLDVHGRRTDDDPALQLELKLPRTVVLGSVVRPDNTPASRAIISVLGNGREFDQVYAQQDGTFQISALSPGSYRITAEDFLMTSDVVNYEVHEDDNAPLRLVLRDIQKVEGRVITPAGVPLIGASVAALPRDVAFTGYGFERTNESGRFLLQLPAGATIMDLLLIPPGFATLLGRVPIRAGKFMEITVDPHGGTLVAQLPAGASATVSTEGATWPLESLARAAGGAVSVEGTRQTITVPVLGAGQYSICIADQCKSGYVPPHGKLELSLR